MKRPLLAVALATVSAVGVSVVSAPADAAGRTGLADQAHRAAAVADLRVDHVAARSQRGDLVRARPLRSAAALPSAAANYFVKYTSIGARGQRIVVSGTVALPPGKAPRHGWPVISWAHGTTGTGDPCAPSRDTPTGPAHSYLSTVDQTLDRWLGKGFAVVKTDYEGLGTRGVHPYINGKSEANSVVDIVRAARELNRHVGRSWFAVGHSQGGHAALFTAAAPQSRHDVRLRGAVALAPGGVGISQTAPFFIAGGPGAQESMGFLATIMAGAAAADPAVDLEALLTDPAEDLVDLAETECLAELSVAGMSVPPTEAFEPGADLGALTTYLTAQEPEHLTLAAPTMVLQGTADALVSKPSTDYLVSQLRQRSDEVLYITYDGADHRGVVAASFADQLAFVEALLPH